MISMTTFDAALKDIYLDVTRDQINLGTGALYNKIETTSSNIEGGRKVVKAAPWGVNGGTGAFSETGSLPTAGGNKFVNLTSELKNLGGVISLSDKVMKASKTDSAAFANALKTEMDGLIKSAKFSIGSALHLKTDAIRTACKATDDAVTVNVDSVQYLIEGMIIDIVAAADGSSITGGTGRRIAAVDRVNKTIKLDGATKVTTTTDHCVVEQGSYGNNITGIADVFAQTGSIYGLDRGTYTWLKSNVTTTATDISDALIIKRMLALKHQTGAKIDLLVCHPDVYVEYYTYLETTKRNINTMELKGGFTGLSINNIALTEDPFVKPNTLELFDTTQFHFHQLEDFNWLDDDGKILKWVSGYAAWTAAIVKYCELLCDHPGAQGAIEGINITA